MFLFISEKKGEGAIDTSVGRIPDCLPPGLTRNQPVTSGCTAEAQPLTAPRGCVRLFSCVSSSECVRAWTRLAAASFPSLGSSELLQDHLPAPPPSHTHNPGQPPGLARHANPAPGIRGPRLLASCHGSGIAFSAWKLVWPLSLVR